MSAICCLVSMWWIVTIPSDTNLRKWWYLMTICFVQGVNFGLSATLIQLTLSLKSLQWNLGFGLKNSNTVPISSKRLRNREVSSTFWERTMYSASVVLRALECHIPMRGIHNKEETLQQNHFFHLWSIMMNLQFWRAVRSQAWSVGVWSNISTGWDGMENAARPEESPNES